VEYDSLFLSLVIEVTMAGVMNELFGSDSEDEEINTISPPNKVRVAAEAAVPNVGGGRGLVATTDVPAGTLVIAETALLIWPDDLDHSDPLSMLEMAHMIVGSDIAMKASESMFPKSIYDVEPIELENIKAHLGTELSKLFPEIEELDFMRILLVIQHNGFKSGFYNRVTLLNHSCQPNCIKFNPSNNLRKFLKYGLLNLYQLEKNLLYVIMHPLKP